MRRNVLLKLPLYFDTPPDTGSTATLPAALFLARGSTSIGSTAREIQLYNSTDNIECCVESQIIRGKTAASSIRCRRRSLKSKGLEKRTRSYTKRQLLVGVSGGYHPSCFLRSIIDIIPESSTDAAPSTARHSSSKPPSSASSYPTLRPILPPLHPGCKTPSHCSDPIPSD